MAGDDTSFIEIPRQPQHSIDNTASTTSSSSEDSSCVQVAIRVRPFLPNEPSQKCIHVFHQQGSSPMIQIGSASNSTASTISSLSSSSHSSHLPNKTFLFDQAYPPETKQKHIFQQSIQPLVEACLKGYNATVLAYGQTGSGKTFTILGSSPDAVLSEENTFTNQSNDDTRTDSMSPNHNQIAAQAGVIPRALRDLFHRLEMTQQKWDNHAGKSKHGQKPFEYEVRVQFLEVYGEDIRDLLRPNNNGGNKLVIRDGGGNLEPEVIGASEVKVNSAEEALLCLTRGTLRRVTGATAMNSESSRSHAIMTVIVEQTTIVRPTSGNSVDSGNTSDGTGRGGKLSRRTEMESKRSKFHFVDLAGSERQKRTLSTGNRLKEGIDINKGLLVLGNVISALGDPKRRGSSFVPYRDSKLTRLLKGSLGGNHKTLMIACVSPSSINMEESLNCLRYANRAKNIQNNAVINLDAGSKLVAELRLQVQALAGELLIVHEMTGNNSSRKFTIDTLKVLAKGGNSINLNISNKTSDSGFKRSKSNESLKSLQNSTIDTSKDDAIKDLQAENEKLKTTNKELKDNLKTKSEELFAAKAEAEYYRLQIEGDNGAASENDESKDKFILRMQSYEREIGELKKRLRNANVQSSSAFTLPLSPKKRDISDEPSLPTPSSEQSSRFKAKTFKPIIIEDDEDREENDQVQKMAKKYAKIGYREGRGPVDDEDDADNEEEYDGEDSEDEDETFMTRESILSSHMIQLTKGIAAKQELIEQLEQSQLKYEKMKSFYQDKLKRMTMQLTVQEAEKVKLEGELKKIEKDSQKYIELEELLRAKEKHIGQLKKRQNEVKGLTSIASRNEEVIKNLRTEIEEMKRKKASLEHQLIKERKEHAQMIQDLQKKANKQQINEQKMRRQLAATMAQKKKVQEIAKAHSEEIASLRTKYQNAEKKLRMQTLKRGMMERAGIDPVLVGRNDNKRQGSNKSRPTSRVKGEGRPNPAGDIHRLRDILDEKILEISRKEAAADKLAHEWEDHLDLSNRKQQLLSESKGKRSDQVSDEIEALDFQIKYKESRIRQLASKLSQKSSKAEGSNKSMFQDSLIDERDLKALTSDLPPLAGAQLVSRVLFGMVIRERRRVSALARAASKLDGEKLAAEKLAADKDSALKALIDEAKNERVAMAQNQNEKILSLMEIVQEDDIDDESTVVGNNLRSSLSESVALRLANERIEALESQLSDLEYEKENRENYQAREAETIGELKQLTTDYGKLLETSTSLRKSLIKIKTKISATAQYHDPEILSTINKIIDKVLKSTSGPSKEGKEKASERGIVRHYESDSEVEDEGSETPEWATHIMKDLAIIAAGDVPESLKTPRGGSQQRLPRTPSSSVFDRLSAQENFSHSHYERLSDNGSVGSVRSNRSNSRSRSGARPRYQTPTKAHTMRAASPLRQRSPRLEETVESDRLSSILKNKLHVSVPSNPMDDDDHSVHSMQSFRSIGSRSDKSNRSRRRMIPESKFVKAYTNKNVFERLQKKHTNSFNLNMKSHHDQDN